MVAISSVRISVGRWVILGEFVGVDIKLGIVVGIDVVSVTLGDTVDVALIHLQ